MNTTTREFDLLHSRFADMPDVAGYLQRMGAPLLEKLRIAAFISKSARKVLDVGAADGTLTIALAKMFPETQFVGIDVDENFVKLGNEKAGDEGLTNVRFLHKWLHDMLWPEREEFDVVIFCSVLHEFYSYGQGKSSVFSALADAQRLLGDAGAIIVRDMILDRFTKSSSLRLPEFHQKVLSRSQLQQRIVDFIEKYGEFDSIYQFNHFLLKYMYEENWQRELDEHYVAVVREEYHAAFELLEMNVEYDLAYVIAYLADKWKRDFGLTDEEVSMLVSTRIMVARKHMPLNPRYR